MINANIFICSPSALSKVTTFFIKAEKILKRIKHINVFVSSKASSAYLTKGFDAICKGEYDHLPEAAFYMVGGIEEVVEKAEKMSKDNK